MLLWGNVTHQQFRIEWFIYAQTFSYIITALVALSVVVKKASFRKLNWNTPFFLMIIKQSLPFALLVLLMAFYNRFDSVMIVKLLGDAQGKEQSGIYAHAFRLLDASNNFAYLFSVLLLPIFARLIKETQNVSHLVRLSFSLLFVVSVTFALTCWAFRLQITELMYFHLIEESAVVLGVLIFCFIPISTNYVFGTLLTANGNLKQLNIVAASGMIFNIGLNLWLIPQIGALGSAWASLVTQSIMAILQILLAALFFKFQFNVKYVLRLMLFCCGVVTIVLVMRNLNLDWIKAFLIANVLSMLLAMALGLLNITKFLGLFTGRLKNI
ncbi:Lipid III flippase [anaerobic digester metagenome]